MRTGTALLLPLLAVDFSLPWSTCVGCSDATLFGYAVQEAEWPLEQVQAVGRWSDRWRFKFGAGDDPRQRALAEAAGCALDGVRPSGEHSASCPVRPDSVGLMIDRDVPEVPSSCIRGSHWRLLQARR